MTSPSSVWSATFGPWWWLMALKVAPISMESSLGCSNNNMVMWLSLFISTAIASMALLSWLAPGGPAWWRHRLATTIAGPRGLPMLGNLLTMKGLAHRKLATMARQYNTNFLMAISAGWTPTVICGSVDAARELLNSSCFADRPVKESARELMFERAIGFAPFGDYWRHLRRLAATHLFCPRRIATTEHRRAIIAATMVRTFEDSKCRVTAVRDVFHKASLDNMMGTVFGNGYADSIGVHELSGMVKEGYDILGIFNWADHLPFLSALDLQGVKGRCRELVPKVHDFVQNIIDRHRTLDPAQNDDAFVGVLLSMQGSDRLDDTDMVAVLWEMVFRGTDTVAILLEWIMARVIMHPEIQARIHEEMDRVVGGERALMESDIVKLEYMQAVVKEVLRMHPPGPLLSWARLAIHDVHVGGHLIPAGTTAMVNMWAITHDEEVWRNPNEFRPERFLAREGGEDVNIMGSDLRLAPFGSGRRSCPGKALGLQTVHSWLAKLLYHFQWFPCPQHPVDLSEVLKLSCEMKCPLHAIPIIRRNSSALFQ